MSAKQAFALVVGLIVLSFIEAILKNFMPGLPFIEAVTAQFGLATTILTTKTINDVKEMKYADGVIKLSKNGCDDAPPK